MSTICFFKNVSRLNGTSGRKHFIRTVNHYFKQGTNNNSKSLYSKCVASQQALTHESLCLPQPNFRSFSSFTDAKPNTRMPTEYTQLYLLEKIRFLRLLGRFSKYSFLSFALGVPVCVLSTFSNIMPVETSQTVISVLGFYCFLFIGNGFLFTSRILAKFMISEEEGTIKLSHLSVFGDRRDVFIKPSDIVPFSDVTTEVLAKKMVIIKLKNSKKFIFMPEMGGIDTNYEVLEMILSGGLNEKSDEA